MFGLRFVPFLFYSELKFGNRVNETNLSNVTWTISIVVQLFFLVKTISERSYTSAFGIRFYKAFDLLNLNLKQFPGELFHCTNSSTPFDYYDNLRPFALKLLWLV